MFSGTGSDTATDDRWERSRDLGYVESSETNRIVKMLHIAVQIEVMSPSFYSRVNLPRVLHTLAFTLRGRQHGLHTRFWGIYVSPLVLWDTVLLWG